MIHSLTHATICDEIAPIEYTYRPFDDLLIEFVDTLAKALMASVLIRQYSDLAALGFWFRKSNIMKIKSEFVRRNQGRIRVPRGRVLHFAPANVDTIFAYSMIISLLLGNTNIVRLPSKASSRRDMIIQVINDVLQNSRFAMIRQLITLVQYGHDREITLALSKQCHARVIWGGDASVAQISEIPSATKSVDIKFGSKRSLCLLSTDAVSKLATPDLQKLAINFANDSYWFGQLGCSSPRLVIWVGTENRNTVQRLFWHEVLSAATKMDHEIGDSELMQKLVTTYEIALRHSVHITSETTLVTRIRLDLLSEYPLTPECGYGLFYEVNVDDLNALSPAISQDLQTITYFGIDPIELHELPYRYPAGIDRIVPVGTALDFNYIWDGWDLTDALTRDISIITK